MYAYLKVYCKHLSVNHMSSAKHGMWHTNRCYDYGVAERGKKVRKGWMGESSNCHNDLQNIQDFQSMKP